MYRKNDTSDVIREMQQALAGLGYYSGSITGHFGDRTVTAVTRFQRSAGLSATGSLDGETVAAIRAKAEEAGSGGNSSSPSSASPGTYYTLDWYTAKNNNLFSRIGMTRGQEGTLTDLETGRSLQVRIQSAGAHADVEPVTARDTSTLCGIYGVSSASKINYVRRPAVFQTSEGYRIVCSIYGTPHGQQDIKTNNYPGQFCLHFLNSKTSGSKKVDSDHQAAIKKAASMVGGVRTLRSASDL